ncbi:MAG: hypothetical protein WA234_07995, partial [Rectinemataceae bacterium]
MTENLMVPAPMKKLIVGVSHFVTLVRGGDTLRKVNFMLPAKRVEAGYIQELTRRAVGFGAVPQ